ncbi:hypothetical protein OH492_09395 [Vibrio chagasii]|nr:hypothetical protein [Vibrio chagasii]
MNPHIILALQHDPHYTKGNTHISGCYEVESGRLPAEMHDNMLNGGYALPISIPTKQAAVTGLRHETPSTR